MAKQKAMQSIIQKLDQTYEFDREPVSEKDLQSGKHFAGLFSGEHVAATEFVIGALFVSWGARTFDVLFGLIFGNLLAVLSWTLVCAPIAVQTRLTLYWYLRKIAGPHVTVIYNILNAILYCILAGAMFTVSASAIRIYFSIPPQTHWYPQDMRFVLVVLVVGAVVVTLAIAGFKRLAQFAIVCSPWMFLMFICGAIATLPMLAASVPGIGQVKNFSDFITLADKTIWTGQTANSQGAIGFWHIVAFAWICNLAMHIGLSDLAIFRYAKKASYGLYSAFGMYLGHYLAWITAGIMGAAAAVALKTPLIQLDSGAVAVYALGLSGAVAVVLAGWTTANPTLYRAGLALQVITPGWPRWLVTLIAGVVTTIIACFPFVFTKLLDFVGIYGLLLVPMGTVVVVEHWIFPKIGLNQYWASRSGVLFNWPALASWVIAIFAGVALWQTGMLHLFFLLVPVWILTAIFYIVFSWFAGAAKSLPAIELKKVNTSSSRHVTAPSEKPKMPSRPFLISIAGWLALVALVISLAMPLWVFNSSPDTYATRITIMKNVLTWLAMIYFVCGTYWLIQREKIKAMEKGSIS
jgi:NCS1 family nucleobase:cation symporter-1